MTIRQRQVGDVVVLDIDGKIVGGVDHDLFQEKIRALLTAGRHNVLVNLENVKWVNSTGLGVLIAGFRTVQTGGGRLKLLHVSERIHSLLTITRLSTKFEMFESEDEATASFAK
jgi:anti-sigma B factor antagonist